MEYLVTGGAGFIGSHLVERLVKDGRRVRVLDNFLTGKRENLAPFGNQIELLDGDMADPSICQRACQGVRVVLHEAALPSVPKSVADPVASHRSNVQGTFNMLVAARDAKVERFIYAGSSSAYGESEVLPKVETIKPSPLSPYAVQKLTGEYYCTAFARCYGMATLTIRYFNVFGPRQDPTSQYAAAIPAFITAIAEGRAPTVYGDGEQTRDFTYIDNIIEANLRAVKTEVRGEVINVACGESISINAIIQAINAELGKNIRPNYVPPRPGDIKHSWADVKLAEKVIGFRPIVTFRDGLRKAIDWYTGRGRST
ncbi:MAG TPA: SDR family oxidoreductase [Phycisphaerae bacterium]|nr:SDR family oxidoreductase [Phycisphaerae bacterium]